MKVEVCMGRSEDENLSANDFSVHDNFWGGWLAILARELIWAPLGQLEIGFMR